MRLASDPTAKGAHHFGQVLHALHDEHDERPALDAQRADDDIDLSRRAATTMSSSTARL